MKTLSISELRSFLTETDNFLLLDVRSPLAYQRGHIAGAISAPLSKIESIVSDTSRDQRVVVYCQNSMCSMSVEAALVTKNMGFQEIWKLDGGYDEWEILGYPTGSDTVSRPVSTPSTKSTPLPVLIESDIFEKVSQGEDLASDTVVEFLEKRAPRFEFDYVGYETKNVEKINTIFLMINPDPKNLQRVPANSLVICHHKISVYQNHVYKSMLEQAKERMFNVYNFHLGWDTMREGIGEAFLNHLDFSNEVIEAVDLTYKGSVVPRLGYIVRTSIVLEELVAKLKELNVDPCAIINPQCQNSTLGYIPGGGFSDNMIIEMRKAGVDLLISADPNWTVEIVAREIGMSLIVIDHYTSERYGLQAMKSLLNKTFPKTPSVILENVNFVECPPDDCPCCTDGLIHDVPVK